jgi:hypothetical protein
MRRVGEEDFLEEFVYGNVGDVDVPAVSGGMVVEKSGANYE